MPIVPNVPPTLSLSRLRTALAQIVPLKQRRNPWMRVHPGEVQRQHILYPHPVYTVQLLDFLDGRAFRSTLRRVGWIYFLKGARGHVACAEVASSRGKRKGFRLTEGTFVTNAFRTLATVQRDNRLRRRSLRLRAVRVDPLHTFAFWLAGAGREEFWIPVTPIGSADVAGEWLTRKDFADALLEQSERVSAAQDRAALLAKTV